MDKNNLYDWVFHYNPYQNLWYAATRDNINALFSGKVGKGIIASSSINTLTDLVSKSDGTVKGINKAVRNSIKHVIVE